MSATIHHGDCLEIMATLPDASVDAIVTDPPYGLAFMGKRWDHGVPGVEFWTEALRVAKPGAHLLAFGGTRTYHRIACAIEDAGWQIRDCVMWVYGNGFPKSHDVSKAIDKAAEHWRGKAKGIASDNGAMSGPNYVRTPKGDPVTAAAAAAAGWGTALKPAWEPIIVARKPLCGTVAENVLKHGTGGINVDGCRVGFHGEADKAAAAHRACRDQNQNRTAYRQFNNGVASLAPYLAGLDRGRWPANVIHDGSDEVVRLFPQSDGRNPQGYKVDLTGDEIAQTRNTYGGGWTRNHGSPGYNDSGSAARFFYCAKASKADRDADNNHPTVKPTALMRYLCRLVTPPGGVVLDPFTGSGSTGKAATLEGFQFIGIEREARYCELARARIAAATPPLLRGIETTQP